MFRALMTPCILPYFRRLQHQGYIYLAAVKGFFWKSYSSCLSYQKLFLARQKRARQTKMCMCDLKGFSILPPSACCCLTRLILNFSPRKTQCLVSIATFHSNLDCRSPRQESKFEYKHQKVNLLVISVKKDWQYDTDPNSAVT